MNIAMHKRKRHCVFAYGGRKAADGAVAQVPACETPGTLVSSAPLPKRRRSGDTVFPIKAGRAH